MSQYRGSGYRGPADRSRSPPRFGDRRPSTASIFDGRHAGPPPSRNASDAPRGPRSQFDGPPARGPPPSGLGSGSAAAPRSLRDAPPLGASDRGRPFRERDYPDRRERSPPLRERSPPRKFNEPRDFPPRDIDTRTARRSSRDGPPSAGSNYSDNAAFGSASSFRGGFGGRGRGRGDSFFERGSVRGGRRAFDDRPERPDLFRQRAERSPPPRFGRDLSRDGREPDRRDDRRYERREDDRRPEWLDRERDLDRERTARRDPPPGRLETRLSTDSVASVNAGHSSSAAPPINPERLAIIESSGADTSIRRLSSSQAVPATARRDLSAETPAYLNGRAETTANRYGSRGSSPPTQAPPVPAFSFSVAPTSASNTTSQPVRTEAEARPSGSAEEAAEDPKAAVEDRPAPPSNAPTAPKAAPAAPKAHHASPPPSAPRAPRALEIDTTIPPSNRLQGVRSMESLAGPNAAARSDAPTSPGSSRQALPHLAQPISPNPRTAPRFGDFSAPTGPRAVRASPAQASVSPRPTFASPRSDVGAFQHPHSIQRGQTPPPSAPSGPRKRSFSVSPKVPHSSIPTAPKASRAPPLAPRAGERPLPPQSRPAERLPPFAPPSGPRGLQWNQWRRQGAPLYGEKLGPSVPAKRDANGDEKLSQPSGLSTTAEDRELGPEAQVKNEEQESRQPSVSEASGSTKDVPEDRMDIDTEPVRRKSGPVEGHSARQSFFGKTIEKSEDEIISSSDEDELDEEEDATLLEAKHARKERELKSQMFDLSSRNYRATSPLESIARLARLSFQDLERINAQRDEGMDLDDHAPEPNRLAPPPVQSSESDEGPDIPTPHGEDNKNVIIQETEEGGDGVRRLRRQSPEPISLPYLVKTEKAPPLHETNEFQDTVQALEETEPEMLEALKEEIQLENEVEEDAETLFEQQYRQWREECEDLDREKEEQERLERQLSAEPGPDFEVTAAIPGSLLSEGRRHKFASEYDINMVIKQSEETARIEQEKMDREARKKEADMEKEARLPDQQTESAIARSLIIDENRLRDPDSLTLVFSYEPPANNFTESEQQIFIAAFKDTPKKWGEIASLLPGRTYKDCIHHYYANKWDGRFRDNRAKKFKGGRRGRGGKASRPSRGSALMADLNRGEDIAQAPNDSTSGRPKRAAAPTTFGEREIESKGTLIGQSPAKRQGQSSKEEAGGEKPAKKQRRTGESKPGRKGKTQLAALAAAPAMSPSKPLTAGMSSKEELERAQNLQDASLLASLQGGQPGAMRPEAQIVFNQDGFVPQPGAPEDLDRPKQVAQVAKPAASSYWSVPEQTDFFKYISHFGTDFGAIASHMGTKTQTMIKNHYQRQIDGGRGDLEEAANQANERRKNGEDIGPPPTPTPIIRKNGNKAFADYPQSSAPRAIAPQTNDAPEAEEVSAASHHSVLKHASPPQMHAQTKSRYTTSAQSTPIPAQRAMPSPLPTTAPTPVAALAAMSTPQHPRGLGHHLGSRSGFMAEQRAEPRSTMPRSSFPFSQEQPPALSRPQPQAQPQMITRTPSGNPLDPAYIEGLQQEQERALRLAGAESEARAEQIQGRRPPPQPPHTHGSPSIHPMAAPFVDHKPILEERRPTPPHNAFAPPNTSRPPIFGSSTPSAPPLAVTPLSSLQGRGPYHASPQKQEPMRPGSVSGSTSAPLHAMQGPFTSGLPTSAPPPAATPAPEREPPKRSNLLSILNKEEPQEPKPAPKRDSLPSAPTRVASPATSGFPPTSTPQPMPGIPPSRRETFGQPSLPGQPPMHRSSFGHGSSTPAPIPAALKHEASSGSASSLQQPPRQDHHWPRFSHGNQPSPPANPLVLERDGRPFYPSHRSSMLGSLGQPVRVNPSPPPHQMHGHTRTPSQSGTVPPPREQRPMMGGPPPSAASLHSNPYAAPQQLPAFSQGPPHDQNRAHHSHNNSLSGRTPYHNFGQPGSVSREEAIRREEDIARLRERDEQRHFEAMHAERQRQEHHALAQRQHEMMDMDRRRMEDPYGGPRASHQMQHSSAFGSPFGAPAPGRASSIREQSQRDLERQMQHEQQHRMFQERDERRRQEQQQPPPPQGYGPTEPAIRRPDDYMSRRPTPYSGQSYPPAPPRR